MHEGQMAAVAASMSYCTKAESNFERLEAHLRECKVTIDADSFKHIKFHLDRIHAGLSAKVVEHLDALEGQGGK